MVLGRPRPMVGMYSPVCIFFLSPYFDFFMLNIHAICSSFPVRLHNTNFEALVAKTERGCVYEARKRISMSDTYHYIYPDPTTVVIYPASSPPRFQSWAKIISIILCHSIATKPIYLLAPPHPRGMVSPPYGTHITPRRNVGKQPTISHCCSSCSFDVLASGPLKSLHSK